MPHKSKWVRSTLNRRLHPLLPFLLLLFSGVILSACTSEVDTGAPVEVTVQLNAPHTGEYAGFYVADQYGYYSQENLTVNLIPGSMDDDPIASVLSGSAHIGIASDVDILRAQSNGANITAVASIFQKNPLVVISLPGSNILQPEDLAGKKVGVVSANMDSSRDILFLAMLNQLNIDPESMQFVQIDDSTGANELTSDKVQVASGYLSTREAVQSRIGGIPVNQIFYKEYGITSYINPIFTTESLIREQPEVIQGFIRATMRGYQEALADPRAAAQLCLLYNDQLNVLLETSVITAQIPFIDPIYQPLGWMDRAAWETTQNQLIALGEIQEPVALDRVFNNRFVEEAQ